MTDLHTLVDQGIAYEDDFIETYFKVLRDEGFMYTFGTNLDEAKDLLNKMIEESGWHKSELEKLKRQF